MLYNQGKSMIHILDLAFPAHNSAYKGDLEYLQMIVETGVASLDERDEKGSTPAHKGKISQIINSSSEVPFYHVFL